MGSIKPNGIEWKLYHLSFSEGDGIAHDIVFDVNLIENIDIDTRKYGIALFIGKRKHKKR